MKDTTNRRAELADFLKTRRARLRPAQSGLPEIGRRRTPGLRRDEVAQLAGVGVSWYTWLEQGRDIHVSDQVLESLARALQLDWGERRHLFVLARGQVPVPDRPESIPASSVDYQAVLDALGMCPAYLLDRSSNVVTWNASACQVFGDFESFPKRERNMLWFMFMRPSTRELFVYWEHAARWCLAWSHARNDQYTDETWFMELITDLKQASPEFRAWWAQHDIQLMCDHRKVLNHPSVGQLTFQVSTFDISEGPELYMVVHTPLPGTDTATKMGILLEKGPSYVY